MAILRAKETFFYAGEGYSSRVQAGDLFDADDPCVKGHEYLFETVEVTAARRAAAVETATAEPGERRTRGRQQKPSAKDESKPKTETDEPKGDN